MLLEATVHRIGGVPKYDDAERKFGPQSFPVTLSAIESCDVPGADARWGMQVRLGSWVPVDDDWISCQVTLTDYSGQFFGTRPALVFRRPYDVPTYTLFQPRWDETGVYSLGLRMLGE
jgi:hypothetical protein